MSVGNGRRCPVWGAEGERDRVFSSVLKLSGKRAAVSQASGETLGKGQVRKYGCSQVKGQKAS